MPIYNHHQFISGTEINDNPFRNECPYCKSRLVITEVDDEWPIKDEQILNVHKRTAIDYKKVHVLEDCYLNLKLDTMSSDVKIYYCWTCGWWRLLKNVCICAEEWQIWDIKFGCAGVLKNLNLKNINTPLSEVRDFLAAKYESRINIDPRLFEILVADVFKGLGYTTYVTAYTNDGGIDIIMYDKNEVMIGVQVKRQKDYIEAEQIRAFVGALFLGDYTQGIYVTTSRFQGGAKRAAGKSVTRGIPVELIDADKFYDALKISQKSLRELELLPFNISRKTIPRIRYYGWDTPKNSL